jgi:hypothetical protein
MTLRSFRSSLVALFAACALVACGRPFTIETPDGFVDLGEGYDDSTHEYRASTVEGVILGARAWKNDPKVTLAVAAQALESQVRLGQGAALLEKKDVTARDGTKGVRMRFGHDEPGGSYLYDLAVFVTDDRVYVVEAVGKKELFERATASIDWTLASFDPS